eukprot:m.117370 g.117370  ORF g.117370 m.117370 type:complete len:56 (+) comp21690_c1_seq2:1499-1666(+)
MSVLPCTLLPCNISGGNRARTVRVYILNHLRYAYTGMQNCSTRTPTMTRAETRVG